MAKRLTRHDLLEWLDTPWAQYPQRLQELPDDEQVRFAQQQGYAHPQDLLAHLGAWMEETLRVMPCRICAAMKNRPALTATTPSSTDSQCSALLIDLAPKWRRGTNNSVWLSSS